MGSEAEKFIENINADLFFFSSRGCTEGGMITDSSEREVSVKKAMLKNAQKSYYLRGQGHRRHDRRDLTVILSKHEACAVSVSAHASC